MDVEAGTSGRYEDATSIVGDLTTFIRDGDLDHQCDQSSMSPDEDVFISEGFDLTERYDDDDKSLLVYTDIHSGCRWDQRDLNGPPSGAPPPSGSLLSSDRNSHLSNDTTTATINNINNDANDTIRPNYDNNTSLSNSEPAAGAIQVIIDTNAPTTDVDEDEHQTQGHRHARDEPPPPPPPPATAAEEDNAVGRRSSRISFVQIVDRMTSDSFSARSTLSGLAPAADFAKKELVRCSRTVGNAMLMRSSNTLEFLTTFQGSTGMLQGAPVSLVLSGGCKVFNSTARLERERRMVQEVEELDYFVSHNWSVPRWQKYLALTFYFNFDVAAAAVIPIGLFISVACSLGWIPGSIPLSVPWNCSVVFRAIAVPIFFLVLCFMRDVAALLRFRQRKAFLDCLCIDQTNAELKQQSIIRLGAFINSSHKMLVLYTDVYLRKLWTTYEVAAFCAVRKMKRMKVVPVGKASVYLITIFCAYIFGLGRLVVAGLFPVLYKRAAGYIVASVLYIYIVRRWKRWKLETRARIEKFQLIDCICSDERDRPLVYSNIATLMRGVGKVSGLADQSEALRSFEKIVRTKLPDVFGAVSFRSNFKYRHYLFLGFVSEGTITIDAFTGLQDKSVSFRSFVVYQAFFLFIWSAALPLAFVVGELVAHFNAHLRGYREHIYLGLAGIVTLIIPGIALNEGLFLLVQEASTSDDAALAVTALPLIGTPLVGRLLMAASGEWKIRWLATDDDEQVDDMNSSVDGTLHLSESQEHPTVEGSFEDQFFGEVHLQQSKV